MAWGEARRCSAAEQVATMWCILNRVDSDNAYFPDDVVAVVYRESQFHSYHSDDAEYIAWMSKGKDSLKMLDVIYTRGHPPDRITITDVQAADTIRTGHPKIPELKPRFHEFVWSKYHIEGKHLCAMQHSEKDLCDLYCKYAAILSPSYESSYRDDCWFCHTQGVNHLRLLRKNYTDLLALLMK